MVCGITWTLAINCTLNVSSNNQLASEFCEWTWLHFPRYLNSWILKLKLFAFGQNTVNGLRGCFYVSNSSAFQCLTTRLGHIRSVFYHYGYYCCLVGSFYCNSQKWDQSFFLYLPLTLARSFRWFISVFPFFYDSMLLSRFTFRLYERISYNIRKKKYADGIGESKPNVELRTFDCHFSQTRQIRMTKIDRNYTFSQIINRFVSAFRDSQRKCTNILALKNGIKSHPPLNQLKINVNNIFPQFGWLLEEVCNSMHEI